MSRALTLIVLSCVALAAPAKAAEPRSPQEQTGILKLAEILGRSHALRQVCRGEEDGFWYDRMQKLIAVESPDDGFRRRLVEKFNEGFGAQKTETPACPADADSRWRDLSAQGAQASRALSAP